MQALFAKFAAGRLPLSRFCRDHHISVGAFRKFGRKWVENYQAVMAARQAKGNRGAYRRGCGYEYELRDFLERRGYYVARSAGSHSPIDLIALRAGSLLLIQAKYGYGHSSVSGDFTPLLDLAESLPSATALLAHRVPHGKTEWWKVLRHSLGPWSFEPDLFRKKEDTHAR